MSAQDGGPAFPSFERWDEYRDDKYVSVTSPVGGMSLRDYFAAKALVAIMPTAASPCLILPADDCDLFATTAYMLADAMLKAREVKP